MINRCHKADPVYAELCRELGVDQLLLPYDMPDASYEIAKLDGEYYSRWRQAYYTHFIYLPRAGQPAYPPDHGAILCPCGSKEFRIHYGAPDSEDRVWAVCVKCGTEHLVYYA